MLKGAKQFIAKAASRRVVPLILFSVAGRPFAMKAHEVGGVEAWPVSMPMPGTTPHWRELIRRGDRVYAVYDLAGQWSLAPDAATSLCMMVKWGTIEVAIRVDSQIPSLETAEVDMIRPATDLQPGLVGRWTYQGQDVPVVSLFHVDQHLRRAA